MLGLKNPIHEMFPNLVLLDLSYNSLYDRLELLTLNKIPSMFELDLEHNPCCSDNFIEKAIKEYPNLTVINNIQVSKNIE